MHYELTDVEWTALQAGPAQKASAVCSELQCCRLVMTASESVLSSTAVVKDMLS